MMDQKENVSYNRILQYIKQHPNMQKTKKRFLMIYAFKLKINNIENIENESIDDLKQSFDVLKKEMINFEKTMLAKQRKETILTISKYLEKNQLTSAEIKRASIKIDMLYILLDLPLRSNSGLAYHLKIKENTYAKKWNILINWFSKEQLFN